MYGWLWRKLPGETGSKLLSLVLITALVIGALWFLVFPWLTLHAPIDVTGVAR